MPELQSLRNKLPNENHKKADNEFPAVHIKYQKSFCDYNCNKCSEVCPSGAIRSISLPEKQKTQIGLAAVNEDSCIQCGLCVMECPRSAITKPQGEFPQINPGECIGCGACQAVCPVSAIKVGTVNRQKSSIINKMADSLLPQPKEINMSIGLSELVLILVVVLLLFGGKRIPELAKALGKASYEYKKAKEALENEAASFKETIEKVLNRKMTTKKQQITQRILQRIPKES